MTIFQGVLTSKNSQLTNDKLLAILGASAIVFVWSGWIIISRVGVQTNLTPHDITMLRYGTGTLFTLPFALKYNWKKITLWKAVVVSLGCGFPYTMLSFYGLQTIKAANAGVVVNGLLPVFGALFAYLALSERVTNKRLMAIGIILVANLIMIGNPQALVHGWTGWVMLIGASLVFSSYMFLGKRWGFGTKDVLAFLPLINAAIFLPWWLLSDSGIPEASLAEILLQASYQGVLVSVIALMITFYAIQHLGAMTLSIFFSFVPFVAAILAWMILGESLSIAEISAIGLCSIGLVIYARK